MSIAPIALGFGLGVLATGLLLIPVASIAAAVAWRWARAFERATFDFVIQQSNK